ncbi:MAG: nitroreductase [Oscillospiraceae bacterium]|nr:nitroreductase [Oscillospiraceae bacterium]
MNEIIRQRKSIRTYERKPLDEATLANVREQIANLKPLYPDIKYSIDIADKTKGLLAQGSGAPNFLVFRSEESFDAYTNIGFIGQQMDLYFSANGLGSCWLGMAKPIAKSDLPYVISMAFGKPAEPLHRSLSEFTRKPLSEISEGTDERLEAARLAPSGMNAQGWFFVADSGVIRCYRKKSGFVPEKLSCIDIGIALWHIASESEGFRFSIEQNAPERKGFIYAGTVGE